MKLREILNLKWYCFVNIQVFQICAYISPTLLFSAKFNSFKKIFKNQ